MSDTVALVAVERVVRRIRGEVSVNPKLVHGVSTSRGITFDQAKEVVLTSAARKALSYAKSNEEHAVNALVIVNGRVNRLPQCTKLLRKHDLPVVRTAYEIKEDLAVADTSLRVLCQFVEHTDRDLEGEASRLRGMLEEIAIQAVSEEQQWFCITASQRCLSKAT